MFNNKLQFSKKIYLDIDSLFDFRLGALLYIDEKIAFDISSKKEYYTRKNDTFIYNNKKLDSELFNKIINTKINDFYKNTIVTKIDLFLIDVVKMLNNFCANMSIYPSNVIDLNFYPLNIPDKEKLIICKILEDKIGGLVKVTPIYVSKDELTPSFILSNYSTMVMYNYINWLNNEKFKKIIENKSLKDIMLFVPMIYNTDNIPDSDIKKIKEKGLDQFELTQGLASSYIKLLFIPINVFCANIDFNKEEYKFNTL